MKVYYWLQGFQSEDGDPKNNDGSWMQILINRMQNDFVSTSSSSTTLDSETAMSLGSNENVYFYIEFAHPNFSQDLIAFKPEVPETGFHSYTVSPFDTGGVATGKIVLSDGTSPKELIQNNSFGSEYKQKFADWANNRAFDSPVVDYIDGKCPKETFCHSISPTDSTGKPVECRNWIWEVRMKKKIQRINTGKVALTIQKLKKRICDICMGKQMRRVTMFNKGEVSLTVAKLWIDEGDLEKIKRYIRETYKDSEKTRIAALFSPKENPVIHKISGEHTYTAARDWLKKEQLKVGATW